jgi:nucleotide-binding universal stress UspA family protein
MNAHRSRAADRWPTMIVVGVDDSAEAQVALDRALELAMTCVSTVVIVHAVGLLEGGGYRPTVDLAKIAATSCRRTGCAAELIREQVVEQGSPAEVLAHVCERVGADLIVVGRRGQGLAWPIGSTSEAMLARSTTPVLVVSEHVASGDARPSTPH